MNNTPTPLDVYRREQKEQELIEVQQSQMKLKSVKRQADNFNQSLNASKDTYIVDALKRGRQSKVPHSDSLTRISSSWFYNQTLDSKEKL
jgi:hypothetical protein